MRRETSLPARLSLILCCLILVVFWLPGVRYPVVSDAINYAQLGESVWRTGTYVLAEKPYANHLPLHAVFSFPFTQAFGVHLGMHVWSLVGGWLTLVAAFFLARSVVGEPPNFRFIGESEKERFMAWWSLFPIFVVTAILIHPAFVLMAMLGSADLLFCGLFLLSLFFFLRAEKNPRIYLLAGFFVGLACLTRYNGVPLFLLFLGWTTWKRPRDLKNPWFWSGMILGGALFSIWLIRNQLTFGNLLHSEYTTELQQEAPNMFEQLMENAVYYLNPLHNVFPFFFVLGLWGIVMKGRQHLFLLLAMVAGAMVSAIWWVQAIRFMFPAFVIFLLFSVFGLYDVISRLLSFDTPHVVTRNSEVSRMRLLPPSPRLLWAGRMTTVGFVIFIGLSIQSFFFCAYTYGACNAFLDRMIGILPKNMGLTSEGMYAWSVASRYINENAEPEAVVIYDFPRDGHWMFRKDLIVADYKASCPWYAITQRPEENRNIVFKTDAEPATFVVKQECVR